MTQEQHRGHQMRTPQLRDPFGFLFVHFTEGVDGEQIFFSLSEGDDPLRWTRMNGGAPVLRSDVGTGGVRDPVLARDEAGHFHILATDLRVEGSAGTWEEWVRTGSRSLVIWDSVDLVNWSEPRLVNVAPREAGMAWAPEVTIDPDTGESVVFWSSRLYPSGDLDHSSDAYSRILYSRTRDFRTFGPAAVMIDTGRDVIDTAILHDGALVHRVSKDEDRHGDSSLVFQEVGSALFATDFRIVANRIASGLHRQAEAPILVRDPRAPRWFLFLDQYERSPQGYFVLESSDLLSGIWTPIAAARVSIPPGTKHGGMLPLERSEWERLSAL